MEQPAALGASAAKPERYEFLDALRGWAFFGVLMVHCAARTGANFPVEKYALAGKHGVQLFFLISAFTIFLTLDRARQRGELDWIEFFVRRFFRILPMFWIGLALYAFVPGRAPEYAGCEYTPLDYALTAILAHGFHPNLINSLVPGGWSIAVEAAFYLVAPWCFRSIRSWSAALWLLIASLGVAEAAKWILSALYFSHRLFAAQTHQAMADFVYGWFPTQFPVFACGILAYQIARVQGSARQGLGGAAGGTALLGASAVGMCASVEIGIHGWLHEHVFFALSFILLILGTRACPLLVLVNPATRLIGRVSYSAYLLHFAVLELARNSLVTFLEPAWQDGLCAFVILTAVTLAGSAPLAWLCYRLVERPGIDLGARLIAWHRARRPPLVTPSPDDSSRLAPAPAGP